MRTADAIQCPAHGGAGGFVHDNGQFLCAENERLVKILQDKKFDAGHLDCVLDYYPICQIKELQSQLRDKNYLILAAKLAFLPDDSDFSDDALAREILKRFQPQNK